MSFDSTVTSASVVYPTSVPDPGDEANQAQDALSASPIVELRELRVESTTGTLTISGSVQSFYHKQVAQETVRPHVNGKQLLNQVRVKVVPR